jgi:hypothetical protein
MKRDVPFLMRLTKEEKRGFESAAEVAGIDLSSWARERLRLAAVQDLERVGRKAPFLKPVPLE